MILLWIYWVKYVIKTTEPKKFRKENEGGKREGMKEEGREKLRTNSWKSSRLHS